MIRFNSASTYLILFLIVSLLLRLLGIINFTNDEIISYFLMFSGIAIFYKSILKELKAGIFGGTVLFLSGTVFFSLNFYELTNVNNYILSVIFFILGSGLLMLYIFSTKNLYTLSMGTLLLIIAVGLFIFKGSLTFGSFFNTLNDLISKYWLVALVCGGIILIIQLESKGKK